MIPKYRAWDKDQKCWIKIAALNFDEDGEMWYLAPAMNGFNPVYYENELGQTWELMQSTGLKDKNGTEIFLGDIITIIDDGEEDTGFGWNEEVIFHNGAFMAGDDNLLVNVNFRSVVVNSIHEIKIQ
jgi:uncharacterized phage protein (TIGR01671 family)